jgi:WD40 repeat protein
MTSICCIYCSNLNDPSALAVGFDQTARLWDLTNGNEIHVFKHPGPIGYVYSVSVSNDSKWVVTGSYDGTTFLWDRLTGKLVRELPKHDGHVNSIVFSTEDKWLVTGAHDGARLSDLSTGKEIRFFQRKDHVVWHVCLSADDKWLVTSGFDKTARLWELATGNEIRAFAGHARGVTSISLSSDSRQLATGSEDGTAILWETRTGQQRMQFQGHTSSVSQVALTRDGKKLLTAGSGDCSVRLWDLATGKELCRLISFPDGSWATYDRDGRYDSLNGGNVAGLHWTIGNETRPLSEFRRQFYDPGLLAKHLGFNKEALRKVGDGR